MSEKYPEFFEPVPTVLDFRGFARRFLSCRVLDMGEVNCHKRNPDEEFYCSGLINPRVKTEVSDTMIFPPECEITEYFKVPKNLYEGFTYRETLESMRLLIGNEQDRVELAIRQKEDKRFFDLISASAKVIPSEVGHAGLTPVVLKALVESIPSPQTIIINNRRLGDLPLFCCYACEPVTDRDWISLGYVAKYEGIPIIVEPAVSAPLQRGGIVPIDEVYVLPAPETVGYMHKRIDLMLEECDVERIKNAGPDKDDTFFAGAREEFKDFEGRAWLIFEMVSMVVRGGSTAKISLGK